MIRKRYYENCIASSGFPNWPLQVKMCPGFDVIWRHKSQLLNIRSEHPRFSVQKTWSTASDTWFWNACDTVLQMANLQHESAVAYLLHPSAHGCLGMCNMAARVICCWSWMHASAFSPHASVHHRAADFSLRRARRHPIRPINRRRPRNPIAQNTPIYLYISDSCMGWLSSKSLLQHSIE